jgi:hypothetical protein
LLRVDQNLLTKIDHPFGSILQRPKWNRTELAADSIVRRQISAKRISDAPEKWRAFMTRNSAPNAFGGPWTEQFDSLEPELKSRVKRSAPRELLSALTVPFFHLRFAPEHSERLRYLLLTSKDLEQAIQPVEFKSETQTASGVVRVVRGDLSLDKYSTVPGKPATFQIDAVTRELKSFSFDVVDKGGSLTLHAEARLEACEVTSP